MLAHYAGLELLLRFALSSPLLSSGALELDPRLGPHVPPHRFAEPPRRLVHLIRGLRRRRRRPSSADLPVHRHPGVTDEWCGKGHRLKERVFGQLSKRKHHGFRALSQISDFLHKKVWKPTEIVTNYINIMSEWDMCSPGAAFSGHPFSPNRCDRRA